MKNYYTPCPHVIDCAAPVAAKNLCWPCYQHARRAKIPRKVVDSCIGGRRYHSYDAANYCRFCSIVRAFAAKKKLTQKANP